MGRNISETINLGTVFYVNYTFASSSNIFKYIYIYICKKEETLWVSGKYIKKKWRAAGL